MGMYTEFVFATLIDNKNPEVIDILKYMTGATDDRPITLPDHPFFKCDYWKILFTSDSAYFEGDTHSSLRHEDTPGFKNEWALTVRSNLTNYSAEIEKFLDWIRPYIIYRRGDEFKGYYRYEDAGGPTLIYFIGSDLIMGHFMFVNTDLQIGGGI
jgi:hypothetical protein